MTKQTLMFVNPVSLTLKYNQLVIRVKEREETVTRPIEDIAVVLIEHQASQISIPLLNALATQNVAVIICDDKAMPSAMLMPLETNNTQQETYRIQCEASQPTRKRIWRDIIESKIRNQAAMLQRAGKQADLLRPYYSNVLSGDSDNREGAAARIYWRELFGPAFVRSREGEPPNALLNYAYAILRAATARALMGSGLLPAFGLFHRNRYNAFPLADDIMEPYRPFVDDIVYMLHTNRGATTLDKDTKAALLRILFADVRMDNKTHPLEVALSLTTASLVRALKDNTQHLRTPTFP